MVVGVCVPITQADGIHYSSGIYKRGRDLVRDVRCQSVKDMQEGRIRNPKTTDRGNSSVDVG
jgi:hypothetical protein